MQKENNMKIAVPSKGSEVDNHFGHCDHFQVFTISDTKEIISNERVDSPVGCGCKSNIAQTLSGSGVSVMLAGNMGDGAVRVLQNNGISVVRGCAGDIETVVRKWLEGSVLDSGLGCSSHDHNCEG